VHLVATILASLAFAATPYPPLTLPAEWTPYDTPPSASLVREWRRAPRPNELYPTRVVYFASSAPQTYEAEVKRLHDISTCPQGQTGDLMRHINVCGFVMDADEQCMGKPAHRFVRLANFGPRELVAQTRLLVPWSASYLEVEYDRPDWEFAMNGRAEKDDAVLATSAAPG
jgi:hypothetical protein